MSKRLVTLVFVTVSVLQGADAVKCGPGTVTASPNPVLRGAEVRITVPGAPAGAKTAQLKISGFDTPYDVPLDGNTIAFPVPLDFPLGEYTGIVTIGKNTFGVCEAVKVVPFANWQPELFAFDPEATYESEDVWVMEGKRNIETTKLVLRGSGFLTGRPADNRIFVNSRELPVNWSGCAKAPDLSTLKLAESQNISKLEVFGEVQSSERIELCRVPIAADRKMTVVLKQGNQATKPQTFSVYRWPKFPVALASAFIALFLGLVVLLLVHLLIRHQPVERRFSALKVLFLDKETDTYSLSRFQFYLWTAAALFGYAYLVIGRMLVQGLTWPEVPDGLPAIIAIGLGTTVGAQIATNANGPKGSGNEDPNIGDLVTSGGVAAVDRVQMFVWTIFGVVTFCVAALREGPGTIKILDPVPTSMLYMMGLSSVGYLGGKLARKPGPVITELSITPSEADDTLASAAAPPPTGPPNLTQPIAEAQAIAQKLSANTPAGSADTAVKALLEAIALAGKGTTTADAQSAVTKLVESRTKAELAAQTAADDFSKAGAPADAGRAAEIAQQAASALQDLAASVSSIVSMTLAPPAGGGAGPRFTRVVEVRGRNLSSQGIFEIGDAELPFRMLKREAGKNGQPEVVIREPDNPEMGRLIRLSIDPFQLEDTDFKQYKRWFGKTDPKMKLTFALMNPDGQKAEISFTVPPSAAQSPAMTGENPEPTTAKAPEPGGNA